MPCPWPSHGTTPSPRTLADRPTSVGATTSPGMRHRRRLTVRLVLWGVLTTGASRAVGGQAGAHACQAGGAHGEAGEGAREDRAADPACTRAAGGEGGHAPLPQEATKLAKVQRVLRFPSCWSEVLACHACPQLRPIVDACMVAVNSWSYVDRRSNVDGPASGWVGACVNGVCGRMRPPKPNLLCMIAGESSGVGESSVEICMTCRDCYLTVGVNTIERWGNKTHYR